MSLEDKIDLLTAEQRRTNSLLERLVEANTGDLVRLDEAARRLNISRSTLQRRLSTGVYTPYIDGSTTRVSLTEIRDKMSEGTT